MVCSTAALLYYNINKVKQFALKQLNQQLNATITANDIEVSLLKTFPKVSLLLKNINIQDFSGDTLLNAQNAFLGFDVMQVIKGNYDIGSIKIENGNIKAFVLKNGTANFNIVKSSKSDTISNFQLKLNLVEFNNVDFKFTNHQLKQLYHLNFKNLKLSGNFSDKKVAIKTNIQSNINEIRFGKQKLFSNTLFNVNTKLQFITDDGLLQLSNSNIQLNNLKLLLNGEYKAEKNGIDFIKMNISTEKISIADLLSVVPVKLPPDIDKYRSKGKVYVNGKINGKVNKPLIELNFGIIDGEMTEPESGVKLSNINAEGLFSNSDKGQLKIKKLDAKLGDNNITANGTFLDFDNPIINFSVSGKLSIDDLVGFAKIEEIDEAVGSIQFDLQIKGNTKNMLVSNNNNGTLKVDIAKLKLQQNDEFNKIYAVLNINKHLVNISECRLSKNKTNINLSGNITNWQSFILAETKENPIINIDVKANEILLDDWLITREKPQNNKEQTKPKPSNFNINIDADKFIKNNFKAENINAVLKGNTGDELVLNVNLKNLNTCNGNITGIFELNEHNKKYYLVSEDLNIKNLNITELFKSFNDFGQQTLQSKHISGNINSSVQFVIPFNNDFSVRQNNIKAYADMSITNGKLIEFKPLYSLSRFVKLSELQQLNFAELKNTIVIENGLITIPKMDINNNALNLKLNGKHSFDNIIDYDIELKLSELLKRKRTKEENEYGEEDDDGKGLTLFIKMTGPADNPQIKYNTKAVKTKIKQSVAEEKKNIVNIFKTETGLGKKDTTIKKLEKKSIKNDELEFDEN